MQRMSNGYFGNSDSMSMSRRNEVAVSIGVATVMTAVIGSAAEFTDNAFCRILIRPFALLGFVFGNVHQGSYTITMATLFGTVFALTYVSLRVVARLGHSRSLRNRAPEDTDAS